VLLTDQEAINVGTGVITSTSGLLQHQTALNLDCSTTANPSTSILQLTSSTARVNGNLQASGNIQTTTGTCSAKNLTASNTATALFVIAGILGSVLLTEQTVVGVLPFVSQNGLLQHPTALYLDCSTNSTPSTPILALNSALAKVNGNLSVTGTLASGSATYTASPSGTGGVSSSGVLVNNPNSNVSNSSASLGFYTDTTNGSSALLQLKAANTSNVAQTANLQMQNNSSVGLLFQTVGAMPMNFWVNTNVVALSMDTSGNLTTPQNLTLTGTSSKLCLSGSSSQLAIGTSTPQSQNQLEVDNNNGTNCNIKAYCNAGDCSLLLQSSVSGSTPGRFQIKCNAGGTVTIYANMGNNTGVAMGFNVSSNINCLVMNPAGTATCSYAWSGPAFTATSDSSLKDNQELADPADIKRVFEGLDVKTYTRKDMGNQQAVGFIAQDLQAVLPSSGAFNNLVQTAENYQGRGDMLSIDYGSLVSVLWGYTKQLEARVTLLEAK
jgi:hypothetical protein